MKRSLIVAVFVSLQCLCALPAFAWASEANLQEDVQEMDVAVVEQREIEASEQKDTSDTSQDIDEICNQDTSVSERDASTVITDEAVQTTAESTDIGLDNNDVDPSSTSEEQSLAEKAALPVPEDIKASEAKAVPEVSAVSTTVTKGAKPAVVSVKAPAATTQEKAVTQVPTASIAEGLYNIVSALRSDAYLDIAGGSEQNGAKAQIYSDNATPAQRWRIESVGNGFYRIVNINSGKVLDVTLGKAKSGTKVQQFGWNGTPAQKWKINAISGGFSIISALSNSLVLDVAGGSKKDGTGVQIFAVNGTAAQTWKLYAINAVIPDDYYVLTNSGSGKVLDIANGSYDDMGNVQQYSKNATLAQTYKASYDKKTGYYTFINVGSGKALDVAKGSTARGANVQQYAPNGTLAQQWAVSKDKKGMLTIRSANCGKALDVSNGSLANTANIQIWDSNNTPAQKWTANKVGNWLPSDTYYFYSSRAHGNAIDVKAGSQLNNANIQIYTSNGTNSQRFYLRSLGNGFYTIQNPFSGKYIDATSAKPGANVVQSTSAEQWKPVLQSNGIVFQLKSNPSLVLEAAGGSAVSGSNVQVNTSRGTLTQKWLLSSTNLLADDIYEIISSKNEDYVLDGTNGTSGGKLQIRKATGVAVQLFEIRHLGNEKYRMLNLATGRVLQANYSPNASGSGTITQVSPSSAASQQWHPVLNTDGTLTFYSTVNGGKSTMDLSSGKVAENNPVGVYKSNCTEAQKWKLSTGAKRNYDVLTITLAQIVKWNWDGNPYNRQRLSSIDELRKYMDPANGSLYQFADLRKASATTAAQLNSFILSTSSGQSGQLKSLGAAFVSAAKTYGLNQDYLLAHAILESGWGTSTLANGYKYSGGKIDGKYYSAGTYYNFYGIGAYDSSPLSGGRKLAIINGWNTKEKAVTGAAKWIANNYVYSSGYPQYTLYGMKWDYKQSDASKAYAWHQYATDVAWAQSIGTIMANIYAKTGTGSSVSFIIPKYK